MDPRMSGEIDEGAGPAIPLDHLQAFISYARADGNSFVRRLRGELARMPAPIRAWLDEDRWPDESIAQAIERMMRGSNVVLFVMTPRSVTDHEWCELELMRAKTIGLTVVPLLAHPDADRRILLEGFPPIKFIDDQAEAGWATLARQLALLASPEGLLRSLRHRLKKRRQQALDAGPELRRRYEIEIEEIEAHIAAQQFRVDDPESAKQRVTSEINAGRDHERRSERLQWERSPLVCVYAPPAVPPNEFRDRVEAIQDLERHLADPRVRLVTLMGGAGIGKTAMISHLRERARAENPPLRLHGFIYLSAHGYRPVTVAALLGALLRVVPDEGTAARLAVRLREPILGRDKLDEVLEGLEGRDVVVVVDGVEELLDDQEELRDPELRELVDHLVSRAGHGVRLLFATQRKPVPLHNRFGDATYARDPEQGLPSWAAYSLLRALDTERLLNLKAVAENDDDNEVRWLHRHTQGSPRALELAYGILRDAPDRTVGSLLDLMEGAGGGDMVRYLLRWVLGRLERDEQKVVQVLAIYRRPVLPAAVDHLVQNYAPGVESRPVLERLHRRRLVRRDGDHFYLPPRPDGDEVLSTIPRGTAADPDAAGVVPYTQLVLLHGAADYFAGVRVQEKDVADVNDLRAQLTEIELRIRGEEFAAAFDLMARTDDQYLLGWGYSGALVPGLIELQRSLDSDRVLRMHSLSLLARALRQQEEHDRVIEYTRLALDLAPRREARHRVELRMQLASAYLDLDQLHLATAAYRRAWRGAMRLGRSSPIAWSTAGLAVCVGREGRFRRALRCHAAASLVLRVHTGPLDWRLRPLTLLNAGWVHSQLGDYDAAARCLREGQRIARQRDDRLSEGKCLLGEAEVMIDSKDLSQAVDLAEKAATIGVRAGNRALCRDAKEILALASLCGGELDAASAAAEIALRHRCTLTGYAFTGLVAFRRGDRAAARTAFEDGHKKAMKLRRPGDGDYRVLDLHGLVLCGLALLGDRDRLDSAVFAYQSARRLTAASGVVARNLLLLDQFGPDAEPNALDRVRDAARRVLTRPRV
jgi:tetratricopeptide (TPR) repeat protein